MTDTPKMTPDEALEMLKEAARVNIALDLGAVETFVKLSTEHLQSALSTLSGLRAYWSKFKVGDGVYWIEKPGKVWGASPSHYTYVIGFADKGVLLESDSDADPACVPDADLFYRCDEAEAEARKRNEAK